MEERNIFTREEKYFSPLNESDDKLSHGRWTFTFTQNNIKEPRRPGEVKK